MNTHARQPYTLSAETVALFLAIVEDHEQTPMQMMDRTAALWRSVGESMGFDPRSVQQDLSKFTAVPTGAR